MIIRNIIILLLSLMTGYVLYYLLIRPKVLEPLCLVNSEDCARLGYRTFGNSILINVSLTDYWIWYNGDKIFVYNPPISDLVCKTEMNYEPAYVVDQVTGLPSNYECITRVIDVLKYYDKNGAKEQTIYTKGLNLNKISVLDIILKFQEMGVIQLNK